MTPIPDFDAVVLRMVTHINFTLFSAIRADANAKGGPALGFPRYPPESLTSLRLVMVFATFDSTSKNAERGARLAQ